MEPKPLLPVAMIKQECDEEDVIDLDKYVSIKEEAEEWDSKVRRKLQDVTSFESERKLDSMMKWYIESLKNEASSLTDHILVQSYIIKHLYTFKACLIQLDYCCVDNYLDNMEEIMTFYSNLVLKLLPKWRPEKTFKRQINQMCRKLIYYIKLYLLCREDRPLHVVMKMKVNEHSNECKDFMNHLYRAFLRREPKEKTDLAFCRAYILFQQWKKIKDKACWKSMDELMYTLFDRTARDIETNETLKQVILPQHNSILDALAHIDNDNVIMVREYFKMIQPQNIQDIDDLEINFELDEGIDSISDKTEDPDLEEYYINYRKSMAAVPSRNSGELKEENVPDDDCQFVGVVNNSEIIHEIPDDDDIEEILIWKANFTVPPKTKLNVDRSDLSFLDTMSIPSEHDAFESQTLPDQQSRIPSDSHVLVDEIDSWIGGKENDPNQERKVDNAQQSPAKQEIDKTLSNLVTPLSHHREHENVVAITKAGSEAIVESVTEKPNKPNTQKNITEKSEIMNICPSVTSQSKDRSVICQTSNSPVISGETFCEKQSTSSKEKSDFDSSDQIPTSSPTTTETDTLPHMSSNNSHMSEAFSNSPSSSNLPNHTPSRNGESYSSPNYPDISSTIDIQEDSLHYTEGSEQLLETEQYSRNENITDISGSRESITQSHLDDGNDITIEYPSLINNKELTTIDEIDVSGDKAIPTPRVIQPFPSALTNTIEEHTKGPEIDTSKKSGNKIMYTQKPDTSTSDFCKLNSHKTWQNIKDTHELDNIMSGPVENYISEATNTEMQTTPTDIRSPQYEEGLDDFINYFGDKTRNNALTVPEANQNLSSINNLGNNQRPLILDKIDYLKELKKQDASKVKRVTFDEKSVIPKERPRMLISRKEMNMRSFKAAGIKPTDRNLQSIPVVIVEKLDEWEIEQWHKMSETSRRLRMEKERLQALHSQSLQNTMFKIDYDKTEVSLTQQEVEQLHNNFLGRDNPQGAGVVVDKSSAMVNSVEGLKTRKKTRKRTKQYDNEVDRYGSTLNPAKRKRGRRKKGT